MSSNHLARPAGPNISEVPQGGGGRRADIGVKLTQIAPDAAPLPRLLKAVRCWFAGK